MATLKIRYGGDGYRWYTGVRSIQCGHEWAVSDPHDPIGEHGWSTDENGGQIEHGNFDSTQERACLLTVQIGPRSDPFSGEVYVLVPIGDAWLMGDDGKTIDRIP